MNRQLRLFRTAAILAVAFPTAARAQPLATPAPAPQSPQALPAPHMPPKTNFALMPGDSAPRLLVSNWVKGSAVDEFTRNRVYVIEFGSTTCVPWLRSAPILADLQALYKDKGVSIVALSVGEARGVSDLEAYTKSAGDTITFTVGLDSSGQSALAYMKASGQNGIPVAYIVDRQGRIAWIGHPLDNMDRVLDQVVTGKFDLEKSKSDFLRRAAASEKAAPLIRTLESQFAARETDRALATMDTLAAIDPPFTGDWAVQKFAYLMLEAKDAKKAYEYAGAVSEGVLKDHADGLKSIAWMTLAEPGVPTRDAAMAKRLAQRADDLTNHADPSVLDTLARAQFDSGDAAAAQATLARAIEACKLPSQRKELQQHLRDFTKK